MKTGSVLLLLLTVIFYNLNGLSQTHLNGGRTYVLMDIKSNISCNKLLNPLYPTTKIQFTIPTSPLNLSPYQGEGNRERLITLKVYDVLGNEVATLVDEELPAGEYEVEFNSRGLFHHTLSSGIYFYQLEAGNFIETKKMVLLK